MLDRVRELLCTSLPSWCTPPPPCIIVLSSGYRSYTPCRSPLRIPLELKDNTLPRLPCSISCRRHDNRSTLPWALRHLSADPPYFSNQRFVSSLPPVARALRPLAASSTSTICIEVCLSNTPYFSLANHIGIYVLVYLLLLQPYITKKLASKKLTNKID
jgi:hypothetical protein